MSTNTPETSQPSSTNPLVGLFHAAMRFRLGITKRPAGKKKERRIPRLVYASENGPAKRITDNQGRAAYRPWGAEYTGGKWPRKVRQSQQNPSTTKDQP